MDNFAIEIDKGLSAEAKSLPSKYFYDEKGDKLFQQIMQMDAYYLTKCEYEIFDTQKNEILEAINFKNHFRIVEFGAGDGYKTKVLLKHFLSRQAQFTYMPVDISGNALALLKERLHKAIPQLDLETINAEYFKALEKISKYDKANKVILFLGANIGNFNYQQAINFLKKLRKRLNSKDLLFIGIDLKKDPRIILEAYNDKAGITKAFNLNLLARINNALEGDFNIRQFLHYPIYNPITGTAQSTLISIKKQKVTLKTIGKTYTFDAWEPIQMEISQKYNLKMMHDLAAKTGFKICKTFFDDKKYFADSLWQAVD